ncbi:hypothetical protein BDN70DRAFT_914008 [Pholiota conissans]|uniref:Fe2OG dioxygenase domain-containing protein n=1 Tax=Pholiota conissans TaxID=109636 RepID=A0A9P6CS25_9AGAR|nr:hypothetical protein BDN70DRAFT_914008 [Pholiota conissans]
MKHSQKKRGYSTLLGEEDKDTLESDAPAEQVSGLDEHRILDMQHCDVYYMPAFISEDVADNWFTALLELDSWYQPKLKMYGREIPQSRKIAAYATDPKMTLRYSGQTVDMKYQYPPVLKEIQDRVEDQLGVKFNHVLLNLYEDGSVYIGNHRDNLENKVIASVSLGAPRTFIMTRDKRSKMGRAPPTASNESLPTSAPSQSQKRRKVSDESAHIDDIEDRASTSTPVERKSWILQPGSLVVMQGDTQRYWKHEIPREPKVKEPRISLTFRQLIV